MHFGAERCIMTQLGVQIIPTMPVDEVDGDGGGGR